MNNIRDTVTKNEGHGRVLPIQPRETFKGASFIEELYIVESRRDDHDQTRLGVVALCGTETTIEHQRCRSFK